MDQRALGSLIQEYNHTLEEIETNLQTITNNLQEDRTTNRIAASARSDLRELQGRLVVALQRTHNILNRQPWWRSWGRRVLTTMFHLRTRVEPESVQELGRERARIMEIFQLRSREEMLRQQNLTTNYQQVVAPDAIEYVVPDPPQQTFQQGFNAGGTWGGFNYHLPTGANIHPYFPTVRGSSSETLVGANTLQGSSSSTSMSRNSNETRSTNTADLEGGGSSSQNYYHSF